MGSLSSGGPYTSVPIGYSESEGYNVDPQLLYKIKKILLSEEIKNQESGFGSSGHGHGHVSSHYGPPAPVYGVPQQRVVGIELDHVQQAIQVAQYHQAEEGYAGGHGSYYSGGQGGYSSGGYSSGGDSGYATIGIPSGSYGVPSGSYGVPH